LLSEEEDDKNPLHIKKLKTSDRLHSKNVASKITNKNHQKIEPVQEEIVGKDSTEPHIYIGDYKSKTPIKGILPN
jgi:hypothetical protein